MTRKHKKYIDRKRKRGGRITYDKGGPLKTKKTRERKTKWRKGKKGA